MNDQLSNYFKNFNEQLTDDLGSRFDYGTLLNYGKKKRNALSLVEEPINLSYLKELDTILEKIKTIVNSVNINIDPEKDFIGSALNTYEDRFIVYLLDQISSLLASTTSQIASSTKRLVNYYINHRLPLNEIGRLKGVKALNLESSIDVKDERKLTQLREVVSKLMETHYYTILKEYASFDEDNINVNSVLANESLYHDCYEYYLKFEELLPKRQPLPLPVRNIDYQNYALLQLLLTFDNKGYSLSGASPEFDNKDYLLRIKNLKLVKDNILVTINAECDDHIDLLFKDNKEYLQKGKKISKVSLDLVPCLNDELTSKEEASSYFQKKIRHRLLKGYDNAFVITSILDSQKDNVIIVSPYGNPFDANLSNMIDSCLLSLPGDAYTYSRYCPVCGGHVTSKEQDDYHCEVCGSNYMLLKDKDKKETIWIKRLSNLEGK